LTLNPCDVLALASVPVSIQINAHGSMQIELLYGLEHLRAAVVCYACAPPASTVTHVELLTMK